MITPFAVAARPAQPPPAPEREPAYLAFIRQQPCAVPGCRAGFIQAAHTGGRGLSQKADDRRAIPLCHFHHQTAPKAYHKSRRQFEIHYHVDVEALIRELQDWYMAERAIAS